MTVIPDYALMGTEEIKINGKSQVTGDVRSNDEIDINGQVSIYGSVYAETIKITGKSEVTGEIIQNAVKISSVPIDLVMISSYVSQNNDNEKISSDILDENLKFKISDKDTITLSTGTYYFTALEISGGAVVNIAGNVHIFCAGKMHISGQSGLNTGGNKNDLIIFVDSSDDKDNSEKINPALSGETLRKGGVKIDGQSELTAIVYAPYSNIKIDGKSKAVGSLFARMADVNGESTISINQPQTQTLASIGVKKAGADATFALGEVYSFPNPAKRGKCPTLHIECGVADWVEIRIYNIAGELVDSTEIRNQPMEVRDKYAYEYNWDISDIASGVYIYIVRAKKGGEHDIKKTGKIAVIK
ncbi:MAG: hypothetical protein HY919_04720 [Elusimicrobia bacterium]|nr:hypothetical protein [Elusimicrobiota bacterium]